MNKTEKIVLNFLKEQGYLNIIYEPDGNIPPDFLVNNKIAVEVRLLNQNIKINDSYRGLEETEIPLVKKLEKILSSFITHSLSSSWFVFFKFARPVPSLKRIEKELLSFLNSFLKENMQNDVIIEKRLDCGLEVVIFSAYQRFNEMFLLGGYLDMDSGGWVLEEAEKNLKICIDEKSEKIKMHKIKYQEWWLCLVDSIGFKLEDYNKTKIKHNWDKVIVISPYNMRKFIQL